jgi:fibro-slime domain-containing protein
VGVVRDFRRGDRPGGHPDFEMFTGDGESGIVASQLGSDSKPVYVDVPHRFTTGKANFDQWYRNVPGVNLPYLLYLVVEPNAGVFTFDSESFFPLDDQGFGNEDFEHNFGFTTEVHTTVAYTGGETFNFSGDDDLWVFINGRLAIGLGGVHPPAASRIVLDDQAGSLGISKGGIYALDLFHAERHSHSSVFRIDTDLRFVDCSIVVDIP